MNSQNEDRDKLLAQWIEKAEEDYLLAQHLLEDSSFINAIAFHSQQAAEKYIKAYLVREQIEFPKTHDIGMLLNIVSKHNPSLAESLNSAIILTDYGVDVRYPDDIPSLTLDQAKHAAELAKKVREEILKNLDIML